MGSRACILALLASLPLLVGAGGGESEGRGESSIIGNNLASARRRALLSAHQDSVLQAAAGILGPERATREAERLRSFLVGRALGYVRNYRVIEETQLDNRFVIRVAAAIDQQRLRQELEQALAAAPVAQRGPAPRLGWSLEVRGASDQRLQGQLQARALAGLESAGLGAVEVVSPQQPTSSAVTLLIRGELVLTGEAGVRGLDWPGARAEARLRVGAVGAGTSSEGTPLRGSSGAAPTAQGVSAWAAGQTLAAAEGRAAERALDQALAVLYPWLRQRYAASDSSPAPRLSTLRISGLSQRGQLETIQRLLTQAVNGVTECRLKELRRAEAWFEVRSTTGPAELASALRAAADGALALELHRINGGAAWLTVVEAASASPSR